METFEKRTNCLLCVQDLTIEKNLRSIDLKKSPLLCNTSASLCKVLNLPNFPFEYIFENAGYCFQCRNTVEELELLCQNLADVKKRIWNLRREVETRVKSAYTTEFQPFGNKPDSIAISSLDPNDVKLDNLTFRDALKCFFDQINDREDNRTTKNVDSTPQRRCAIRRIKRKRSKPRSRGTAKAAPTGSSHMNPVVLLERLTLDNCSVKSVEIETTDIKPNISKLFSSLKSEFIEGDEESNEPKLSKIENMYEENEDEWQNDFAGDVSDLDLPNAMETRSSKKSPKPSNNQPKEMISCSVRECSEKMNSKEQLAKHFLEKHPDYKFNCDECNKKYLNKKHLLDHKRMKHSDEPKSFDCDLCNLKFAYAKGLKAHRIKKHRDVFPELCNGRDEFGKLLELFHPCEFENCSAKFVTKTELRAHVGNVHKGQKRFHCDLCNCKYLRENHLEQHKRTKHSNLQSNIVCAKCGKSFSCPKNLECHMQAKHREDCEFRCIVCSKGFNDQNEMVVHFAIHQDTTPFRCDTCEMVFTNTLDLKYHLRTHDITQTKCDICDKIFSSEKNLKDHKLIHNDNSLWPKCGVCQKPFQSERHLRKHSIVHSENNKYKCEECGLDFKYSSYLLKHKRRFHCAEKPFSCSICGKGFYETQQLKRHEEIHSGFKQYVCDICGKSFRTLQNHYQHYKSHNEEFRTQRMYKNLRRRAIGEVNGKKKRKTPRGMKKKPKKEIAMKNEETSEVPADQIIAMALSQSFPQHSVEVEVETETPPPPHHQIEFEVETIYRDDLDSHPLRASLSSEQNFIPLEDEHIQTYITNGDTIVIVNNLAF